MVERSNYRNISFRVLAKQLEEAFSVSFKTWRKLTERLDFEGLHLSFISYSTVSQSLTKFFIRATDKRQKAITLHYITLLHEPMYWLLRVCLPLGFLLCLQYIYALFYNAADKWLLHELMILLLFWITWRYVILCGLRRCRTLSK